MKLTANQIETIKELKKQKATIKELAEMFGVSVAAIDYHINPNTKARHKRNAAKSYSRLREKEGWREKRRAYLREYMKKRYHSDEEFRKRAVEFSKKYQKRKYQKKKQNEN